MVLTEKEIRAAALDMYNDIIQACTKDKKTSCNCVVDNLNVMSYMTPVGEKTQTRKAFNEMLKEFELFKRKKLLTNCTKKLRMV